MHINATLFGQMITFMIFVWFTMRFVWPLLTAKLDARKQNIADGLAAGEEGRKLLAKAEETAKNKLQETKLHCYKLLEDADKEATQILEAAREQARKERDDIIASGDVHIEREINKAKTELQKQLASVAVLGAEKILQRSVNVQDHEKMLNELAKTLS